MLTPIEIHNAQHKKGRGYAKEEMDDFLDEVLDNYETLYKENIELKDKLTKIIGEMEYYKTMEETLKKALVLAEKTAKTTVDTATSKADLIIEEANVKADQIVGSAKSDLDNVRQKCINLIKQYNHFKLQFRQIAEKQIEILDSELYEIYDGDLVSEVNKTNEVLADTVTTETEAAKSQEDIPENVQDLPENVQELPENIQDLPENKQDVPEKNESKKESDFEKTISVEAIASELKNKKKSSSDNTSSEYAEYDSLSSKFEFLDN